jgi:hypothetical protein
MLSGLGSAPLASPLCVTASASSKGLPPVKRAARFIGLGASRLTSEQSDGSPSWRKATIKLGPRTAIELGPFTPLIADLV